ncbi:MAG: VOC family protein [Planctomycetota bacterium]
MTTPRATAVTVVRRSLLLCALLRLPLAAQDGPVVGQIEVTVGDLLQAERFYTEVLQFRRVGTAEHTGDDAERLQGVFGLHTESVLLQLGDEQLELTQYLAPVGRPLPADSRSNDRWFQHVAIIVRDMDRAYDRLRRHRVRHSSPLPQTLPDWNPNAGGIRAFYFQDPDGHPLEVLQFPPGKGDAKWHRAGDDLFLGIDHTAIVVADTEQGLAFWRDALGLRVVGTSDNHGIEQERLNNVFGAHLRITTLRGRTGPGVELLEYLTPHTGRTAPVDGAANDLWHWAVHVDVDLDGVTRALAATPDRFVSPAAVPTAAGRIAIQVRDADGHSAILTGTRSRAAAAASK